MPSSLEALTELGQSPWIDHISRSFVNDGPLQDLVDKGIRGVTSNPTIFQKAIAEEDSYDAQIAELGDRDAKEVFLELAAKDIRGACDLFADTFKGDESRLHGWVSLEVDPNLARDTDKTVAEAKRIHALIDRPNLMVKIPGTQEGLSAIEQTVAAGIPVNVTLLFSIQRHREAAEAYVRGLKQLHANGGDLKSVGSVASFFVSRVDTEADRRLDELGGNDELKGKLAIANAKLAYTTYREVFAGPEWDDLQQAGAHPQRCLWASTSTKNPDYRDVIYVEQLIGPDTVDTMPRETVEAFLDHGRVEQSLTRGVEHARRVLEQIAAAGIEYDDVIATLEREGVDKFAKSFKELLDGVEQKRRQLVNT